MLTGIPLLHYFQSKNEYSGAHDGMRYFFTPTKEKQPAPDGTEQEVKVLHGVIWPDPWSLENTDPALCLHKNFPFSDEGLAQAAQWLADTYHADEARWQNCPGILDSEPWQPTPPPQNEA